MHRPRNQRTKRIIELHAQGLSYAQIAKEVGCSKPNVSQTVARHAQWDHSVYALPLLQQQWLIRTAKQERLSPARVAANLLSWVIESRMHAEHLLERDTNDSGRIVRFFSSGNYNYSNQNVGTNNVE